MTTEPLMKKLLRRNLILNPQQKPLSLPPRYLDLATATSGGCGHGFERDIRFIGKNEVQWNSL